MQEKGGTKSDRRELYGLSSLKLKGGCSKTRATNQRETTQDRSAWTEALRDRCLEKYHNGTPVRDQAVWLHGRREECDGIRLATETTNRKSTGCID